MRHYRALAVCAAVVSLLLVPGCGFNSGNPPVTYPNLKGNWEFELAPGSSPASGGPTSLSGNLTSSGGTVSGVLHATTGLNGCVSESVGLDASGSIAANGKLTLTVPIGGGVATLQAYQVDGAGFAGSASVTIAGGSCALDTTPLIAFVVPNLSGSYSGQLVQFLPAPKGAAPTIEVTANLTQSTDANPDGTFPVTGTVSYTGVCSGTYALQDGSVSGIVFSSDATPFLPAGVPTILGGVVVAPSGKPPAIESLSLLATALPNCPAVTYSGTLLPG